MFFQYDLEDSSGISLSALKSQDRNSDELLHGEYA